VLTLVRACQRTSVDGFYASTQGGEAFCFGALTFLNGWSSRRVLAVWAEIAACRFNILHICDYEGAYDDLYPFLDYAGHVVNYSLEVGGKRMTPREASARFGRPFMGGLERKGVLASGASAEVRRAAQTVLAQAPERVILAADCIMPADASWDSLKATIDAAHGA
jgi:uroporphyrinogen decarboxylase